MTNTKIPILPTAILLFALGFGGRILLHDYHNFETVMVSVFLASMLLPLNIAVLITMAIMVLSDLYLGYMGATKILFFTYTGFLLVSLISSKFKNKLEGKFTSGTVYKFTSAGIIFALVYDMWTNFGVFWLSYGHTIDNLFLVYTLGLPFMIYHLLSSIVTFSLIGFPIYCILTKKSNSDYISEQDLKFEI